MVTSAHGVLRAAQVYGALTAWVGVKRSKRHLISVFVASCTSAALRQFRSCLRSTQLSRFSTSAGALRRFDFCAIYLAHFKTVFQLQREPFMLR